MNKSLGIFLASLFGIMMVIGIFLMIPEPVTVTDYEKIVVCNDGLCDLSVTRHFSDGGAAGTSSDGIPIEWLYETHEETTCENGLIVNTTTTTFEGQIISVASSTSTENVCP